MTLSTELFEEWQKAEVALRALKAAMQAQQVGSPAYCELQKAATAAATAAQKALRAFVDAISRP